MAIYLFLQEVSLQGYLLKTNMQKKNKNKNKQTNKNTWNNEVSKNGELVDVSSGPPKTRSHDNMSDTRDLWG